MSLIFRGKDDADVTKPFYQQDSTGAYKQVSLEALIKCENSTKPAVEGEKKK